MAKRTIDTNIHLKDEKQRSDAMFQSMYTSFEIEGIKIPVDEARKIADEVIREFKQAKSQKNRV